MAGLQPFDFQGPPNKFGRFLALRSKRKEDLADEKAAREEEFARKVMGEDIYRSTPLCRLGLFVDAIPYSKSSN